MKRRAAALWLALALPGAAHGQPAGLASALAVPLIAEPEAAVPGGTELWLAQRSIAREWGLSEDSVYVEVELPGWKSEPGAMFLSAVAPGTGQLYTGEGSGWLFLLAEVGGWVGRHYSQRKADRYDAQAAARVGDPRDTSSAFSFARYEAVTGGDAAALEALWDGDRSAYYQTLASDGTWFAGFRADAYDEYSGLHARARDTKRQTRWIETALWLHHAWSAVDALRAARFQNLPLRTRAPLQLGLEPAGDGTGFVATFTGRF